MGQLPSGTVTVLFTDIAGSTRLWEDRRAEMPALLARHDEVLRQAAESHGGHVVKCTGDGMLAVFAVAQDAVDAAADGQRALRREDLPEVRMALHTGDAVERHGDYFGPTLNRAARLMSIGHGGQVLLSGATRQLLGASQVHDLGQHRLRDLSEPEHVFQLLAADLPSAFPPLRSVDSFPTNLPVQLSSFVGREEELKRIADLLHGHRLVTITGVGGVGKTRLALAAAAESLERFDDGTWLVELETVVDEHRLAEVVSATLRLRPGRGTSVEAALLDWLASRHLLLVLDNCEHLVAACARFVGAVLRAAPDVAVLATSREPLGVPGETVFALRPLDPEGAVQLFTERAADADASRGVAAYDLPHVERVCRGLDGIPLAVELAAARMRTLGAAELARRLDQRFRLLTGGRGAVDRHQTLRATVDWSYELLSPVERAVLDRMSVFAGGCSLDAAEAVIADAELDPLDVVDALGSLADKSLAVADHADVGVRYRLLETIRAYGAERLQASGHADAVRQRHLEHFRSFARAAGRGLHSADADAWTARVEPELGNLRAAVDRAVEAGDTDAAMQIAASLVRQALERPHWGTATLAEAALAAPGAEAHQLRALVLGEACWTAFRRGDQSLARRRIEAAIDAQRQGARFTAAPWTYAMTHATWWGGASAMLALAEEGLARAEEAGDRLGTAGLRSACAVWRASTGDLAGALTESDRTIIELTASGPPALLGTAYMVRSHVLLDLGRFEDARAAARRSLALLPGPGLTLESLSAQRCLALAEALTGRPGGALAALRAALRFVRSTSDLEYEAAHGTLRDGAPLYNALGRADLTVVALAATGGTSSEVWEHRDLYASALEEARRALGRDETERLQAEAEAMSPIAVVELVLAWADDVAAELAPDRA